MWRFLNGDDPSDVVSSPRYFTIKGEESDLKIAISLSSASTCDGKAVAKLTDLTAKMLPVAVLTAALTDPSHYLKHTFLSKKKSCQAPPPTAGRRPSLWVSPSSVALSTRPNGKTSAKMAVARIKLLRNKREVVIRQIRRDIALLLESGQDATARIRVEHVIREQNIMAANELIELFCDLIVARLSIIAKQRECPPDLKEGISSLIFAGPRCSELPELLAIRDIFQKKYGKDFVSAATDLRPNAGVNRLLIEKLSVKTPSGEVKLKVLKEIAKEYQVQWDTTESEEELLKPPEERIDSKAMS
ncbi:IST1-like protein [Salvia splendens]|uniref:IST1-like protein n=1 Tax=Salvia splendens TaxID=180675 RepID=UPI001C256B6D|nr:IST1-like protein [Salvia splendens]